MYNSPEKLLRKKSMGERMRFLLKDSAIYGLLMAVSKFAVLLLIPVYTKVLSTSQYGILDMLLLIGMVLVTFLTVGQEEAVGRLYYDAPAEKRSALAGSGLALIIFCGLIMVPLLLIFADKLIYLFLRNDTYAYEFRLVIIYAFITAILAYFRSLARWSFRKKTFFILSAGPAFTTLAVTYIVVFRMGAGIQGAILAQIATNTFFAAIALFCFRDIRITSDARKFLSPLLKFGAPVMLSLFLLSAVNILDKSLFVRLIGVEHLGIYALGARYALFMSLPLTAFWTAMAPMLYSIYEEKNAADTTDMAISAFAALFGLAIITQFAVAEPVIQLISSKAYAASLYFALPLSLSLIMELFANITSAGIDLAKRPYLNTTIFFCGLIATFLLAHLLTAFVGALGIAYAVLGGRIFVHIARTATSYRVYHFRYHLAKPYIMLALAYLLALTNVYLYSENLLFTIIIRVVNILLFCIISLYALFDSTLRAKIINAIIGRQK